MLNKYIQEKARVFQNLSGKIHLIGHADADGLAASAILISLFKFLNKDYTVSLVGQLTIDFLEVLKEPILVFTDIGSENLDMIEDTISNKEIFILDHHETKEKGSITAHVNPWLFNHNGSEEICGAGVALLFAKSINPDINLDHLAVIGALGDLQERCLTSFNKDFLDSAIKNNQILVKKDLNLFGNSRAIHKVLEYSNDMGIPSITRNRENCFELLKKLNIPPKKRLGELSNAEKELLETEIVKLKGNKENLYKNTYLLKDEPETSPLKDCKEVCTVLNACVRMGKPQLGIDICLNKPEAKEQALHQLSEYRMSITNAMNLIKTDKSMVESSPGLMIINAGDKIPSSIIGTVTSILTRSKLVEPHTLIVSLARNKDSTTKVSARFQGTPKKSLRAIMKKAAEYVGGTFGGHFNAAGALIKTRKEEEFIKIIKTMI